MSYWHAVIALGFIILGAMWVYELWDIFNERIESNGSVCQCSAAKSDARATAPDEVGVVGKRNDKALKSTYSDPLRHRSSAQQNGAR